MSKDWEFNFGKTTPLFLRGLVALNLTINGVALASENRAVSLNSQPGNLSITASYQSLHEQSNNVFASYRITFSEDGLRIDQKDGLTKASIIFNSHEEKMWLVDRNKKLSHEVPINIFKDDETTLNKAKSTVFDEIDTGVFAAFIQIEPCQAMKARRHGKTSIGDSSIQVWLCEYEGEVVEKQWFNTDYGFVVRSESFDGVVSTMSDIKQRRLDVNYFRPPVNYKQVSLKDMGLISQPLDVYDEKKMLPVNVPK